MTRGQREKLNEIMGFMWAKSDDALYASYAEAIADMLAEDEKAERKNEVDDGTE